MRNAILRILPALLISVALVVSALIFERGMRSVATGLYNISHSVEKATEYSETLYQTVQDFPSRLTVEIWGNLGVDGTIGLY